jgi:hypothetical protein
MTTILIICGIAAAVAVLGAYIRWAVGPVADAYQLGVTMGRQLGENPVFAPRPPALEVAAAWLMPWRAARIIGTQRRDINLLIRTLSHELERKHNSDTGPQPAATSN